MELEGSEPISGEDFRQEWQEAVRRTAPWFLVALVLAVGFTELVFNSDRVGDADTPEAALYRHYGASEAVTDLRCDTSRPDYASTCTYLVGGRRCTALVSEYRIDVDRCRRR